MAFNKSNIAAPTTLVSSITNLDSQFAVDNATGYPISRFVVRIGNSYPWELVIVESRDGSTFQSVERGALSTTAASHSAGVAVVHVSTVRDMVQQDPESGHILALVQNLDTGVYPVRPDYVTVVHYFGWDEPPVNSEHPYDLWTQVDPPVPISVPDAPTGLMATAGDGEVALEWNSVTGADTYNVYRNTSDSFVGATAIETALSITSYTDITVTNGTVYYYWVTAVNVEGESDPSTSVSATPSVINVYTTDFQDYTIGVQPNDWTKRWKVDSYDYEIVDLGGGEKALQVITVATEGVQRALLTWDILDGLSGRDNVMVRAEVSGVGGDGIDPRIVSHLTGSEGAESGYVAIEALSSSILVPYDNGDTEGNVSGDKTFTPDGTRFIQELIVTRSGSDDTVEYRIWQKGQSRPATPILTLTKTGGLPLGSFGLGRANLVSSVLFHFFSVGLNGVDADLPT